MPNFSFKPTRASHKTLIEASSHEDRAMGKMKDLSLSKPGILRRIIRKASAPAKLCETFLDKGHHVEEVLPPLPTSPYLMRSALDQCCKDGNGGEGCEAKVCHHKSALQSSHPPTDYQASPNSGPCKFRPLSSHLAIEDFDPFLSNVQAAADKHASPSSLEHKHEFSSLSPSTSSAYTSSSSLFTGSSGLSPLRSSSKFHHNRTRETAPRHSEDSEDDYGFSDSESEQSYWSTKLDTRKAERLSPKKTSHTAIDHRLPASVTVKAILGPKARKLLQLTASRLSSNLKNSQLGPISVLPHSKNQIQGVLKSLHAIVGCNRILHKLQKCITVREFLEIEYSLKAACGSEEEVMGLMKAFGTTSSRMWPIASVKVSLTDLIEPGSEKSDMRTKTIWVKPHAHQLKQSRLERWTARPLFCKRNEMTIALEGETNYITSNLQSHSSKTLQFSKTIAFLMQSVDPTRIPYGGLQPIVVARPPRERTRTQTSVKGFTAGNDVEYCIRDRLDPIQTIVTPITSQRSPRTIQPGPLLRKSLVAHSGGERSTSEDSPAPVKVRLRVKSASEAAIFKGAPPKRNILSEGHEMALAKLLAEENEHLKNELNRREQRKRDQDNNAAWIREQGQLKRAIGSSQIPLSPRYSFMPQYPTMLLSPYLLPQPPWSASPMYASSFESSNKAASPNSAQLAFMSSLPLPASLPPPPRRYQSTPYSSPGVSRSRSNPDLRLHRQTNKPRTPPSLTTPPFTATRRR